jgi:hypothetical protein
LCRQFYRRKRCFTFQIQTQAITTQKKLFMNSTQPMRRPRMRAYWRHSKPPYDGKVPKIDIETGCTAAEMADDKMPENPRWEGEVA